MIQSNVGFELLVLVEASVALVALENSLMHLHVLLQCAKCLETFLADQATVLVLRNHVVFQEMDR